MAILKAKLSSRGPQGYSAYDIAGVKEAVEAAYNAMLFDIIGPPPEEMSNGHFIVGAGPAVM